METKEFQEFMDSMREWQDTVHTFIEKQQKLNKTLIELLEAVKNIVDNN